MNTFKIRAATSTHFTDIDIEAGTIEQAITKFSAIVDEDPSRIFCDQEFNDNNYHPTYIDNISDGTGKELMDYSDSEMPKRWRNPSMVATVPSPITYELELCYFGMAPDAQGMTLAETLDEETSWDVELLLRLEQTGQIETLFGITFDNRHDATEQFRILEDLFPDASQNIHEPALNRSST